MAILDSWTGSVEFKFENLPSKDHLSNYEKYVTDIECALILRCTCQHMKVEQVYIFKVSVDTNY